MKTPADALRPTAPLNKKLMTAAKKETRRVVDLDNLKAAQRTQNANNKKA